MAQAVIEKHCSDDYNFQEVYDLIAHSLTLPATQDLLAEFSINGQTLRVKHDNSVFD